MTKTTEELYEAGLNHLVAEIDRNGDWDAAAMKRSLRAQFFPQPSLRLATEEDVSRAIDGAMFVQIDALPADLLEFFNRMLDVLGVPDADGDVAERVH